MSDRIERELDLEASPEEVWVTITEPGWLAEEVELQLSPGGDASFRTGEELREGWVEDVQAPSRLAFWWAVGEEPATRVELTLKPVPGGTRLRVVETRPLDRLDLVGTPISRTGARTYGPALVAA
ncbi:MAG: SRPBCC domain-containing protein [Actinomycetota bacterium]|nr:SRPBCC domain-containing protein [Actinomycetota bacterium]